ncbi:hypothetical protein ABL840_05045 [Variovorax sp. NFACC27]|uniref:hypothetical protein n=1 Tax=unclassified Variovorax TaxID=663243 RepID=UPI00115FE0AC
MSTKTVYAYDGAGLYIGAVDLDETDMSPEEPGVWLVPGSCLEVAPPPFDAATEVCAAIDGGWVLKALPPPPPPPGPPSLEERIAALQAAVDETLNAAARARRYDSIHSAALRAGFPGPFHDEGMAYAIWMDAVNAKCYEVLALYLAGEIAEPTRAELLAMLPALTLPDQQGA